MKKTKRFPKVFKITKYAALAIVILAAALWLYLRFAVGDIARIDDSAMNAGRTEVPAMQNGYLLMIQAQIPFNDKLYDFERDELKKLVGELDSTGRLSDASMREAQFLFKNRIDMMERAAEMPYSQGPRYHGPDDRVPNFISIRDLSRIRLEQARRDFDAGRREQALDGVKKVMDIGRITAMEQGHGGLISMMISISIKQSAAEALNSMLTRGFLPEDIPGLNTFLAGRATSAEALRNAYRAGYQSISGVLDQNNVDIIYRNLFDPGIKDSVYTSGFFSSFMGRFFQGFIFQKERARKMIFDYHEKLIEDAGKPFSESFKWMNGDVMPQIPGFSGTVALIFRGEYGAMVFAAVALPNFRNGVARIDYSNFAIQATRLRLAALAFKRDKGTLPRTLGELVPAYIDSVPADPFDGKPIRYNPEKKIIYSVGTDAKDDGGSADKQLFSEKASDVIAKEKDLVLGIE